MPAPSIDVVVPVHGKWELTEKCLRSLSAQTAEHRVIVVDDASPDDTQLHLRQDWPGVHVISSSTNVGFAAACNLGIRAGSGDIVVLVNNDVVAAPDMLAEIVAPFQRAEVGTSTPLLLAPDGTVDAFGICVDPTLAGYVRLHGAANDRDPRPAYRLVGPYGAVAAYRRVALDQVGLLDEGIFMYGEELDLALRLSAAGWTPAEAPGARGVHLGGGTSGRGSRTQRERSAFGRGYLLRAWGVLRGRQAVRTLAIEAMVCLADLVLSRDLASTRGRFAGYRAGRAAAPRPHHVPDVDDRIGFRAAVALRRGDPGQLA